MRRFYETLEMIATDEGEKKELGHLLSKEGKEMYQANVKETVTYADLLKKYPSTQLSMEYLIDFIPIIKPRLYSIASSSEMYPNNIELIIVKGIVWRFVLELFEFISAKRNLVLCSKSVSFDSDIQHIVQDVRFYEERFRYVPLGL